MKTPYIPLEWHEVCVKEIIQNDRRGGVMIVKGKHQSGKSRFFRNLNSCEEVVHGMGSCPIFRCPPCGTDREILTRLARSMGIDEVRDSEPRVRAIHRGAHSGCIRVQDDLGYRGCPPDVP